MYTYVYMYIYIYMYIYAQVYPREATDCPATALSTAATQRSQSVSAPQLVFPLQRDLAKTLDQKENS